LRGFTLDRFARVVIGYHGCAADFAESLYRGEVPVASWRPSRNPYDWLGHGIYFWEHAPERAWAWGEGGVVGAVIQLGRCLDLTDTESTELLVASYEAVRQLAELRRKPLPENRGLRRERDCLVINHTIKMARAQRKPFQTIRCPFLEGAPAFPGSSILKESHIQLVVIDPRSILGIFRPNLG
jgi:hypothetical protein